MLSSHWLLLCQALYEPMPSRLNETPSRSKAKKNFFDKRMAKLAYFLCQQERFSGAKKSWHKRRDTKMCLGPVFSLSKCKSRTIASVCVLRNKLFKAFKQNKIQPNPNKTNPSQHPAFPDSSSLPASKTAACLSCAAFVWCFISGLFFCAQL